MSDILVVGGGFAGVWAAAAAARERALREADFTVTLVAPGDDLVIRPRLYEPAPERMRVPLSRILDPINVRHLPGWVTAVDTETDTVTVTTDAPEPLGYGRLVLASGSRLRRPTLPGAEHLFDVDTVEGAVALEHHLGDLPKGPGRFTAVVVGAGFTGLEVATELVGRLRVRAREAVGDAGQARVVLVEQAAVVGDDLGAAPRPWVQSALDELEIDVRSGHRLVAVGRGGVTLDDGSEVLAATTVWTAGIQASPLTECVPGERDGLGRLVVDDALRVPSTRRVFAAGDTAAAMLDDGHTVMPSCQHAIPLGKFAGHNAAADLLGYPTVPFTTTPYVTCLDLGPTGALFTTGFERTVVLSGEDAKQRKRQINRQWIQPPVDDPDAILWAADHQLSTREAAESVVHQLAVSG